MASSGLHILMLLLLLLPPSVIAGLDSQGKEFILGFAENRQYWRVRGGVEVVVTTFSDTPVHVMVTTPLVNPQWQENVTVTSNTSHTVKIPSEVRGVGVEKSNKGVRIQASQPVSVLAVNKEKFSTDVFLALPVDVLGTEYYAITYQRDPELMVVATQEHTQVSVQWPKALGNLTIQFDGLSYGSGDVTNVTLNTYETLHFELINSTADFTGTHITATKPIAVISGNKKVYVPTREGKTGDHLSEMMTPVSTWGKEFVTPSTPDRGTGDVFRFVASQDNTTITLSAGNTSVLEKAGDFLTKNLPSEDDRKIVADKAILVARFTKSFQKDGPHKGDPAMSLVPPAAQYLSQYSWSSVQDHQDKELDNMVSVVIHKDDAQGLRLDGQPVVWDGQKDVLGSPEVTLWVHVTSGVHHLVHSDPSVTFMALATGSSTYNSYAVPVGMGMRKINVLCTQRGRNTTERGCEEAEVKVTTENREGSGSNKINIGMNGTKTAAEGSRSNKINIGMNGTKTAEGSGSNKINIGMNGTKTAAEGSGSNKISIGMNRTKTAEGSRSNKINIGMNGTKTAEGSGISKLNMGMNGTKIAVPVAVDGQWGEWAVSGACSVTCGEGTQSRSRRCDSPPPTHGGAPCPGPDSDQAPCSEPACPVDGQWGQWTLLPCSVTCGVGKMTRKRKCDHPAPKHGGHSCAGNAEESITCNQIACPVSGRWGAWVESPCSVPCGPGTRTRFRQCNNPAPQNGGDICQGLDRQVIPCAGENCFGPG